MEIAIAILSVVSVLNTIGLVIGGFRFDSLEEMIYIHDDFLQCIEVDD